MGNLTKTKYVKGVRCLKALYLNEYSPEKGKEPDESQKMIMKQGIEVGNLAKKEFKGGIDISESEKKNLEVFLQLTQDAIKNNAPAIFEATFLYNNVLVKVDILENTKKGWNLIEVKSSTKTTEEHIHDISIQYYVLSNQNIKVDKSYLMLVNTKCTFPDLSDFFKKEDVTEDVGHRLSEVEGGIKRQFGVLNSERVPEVKIGPYCNKFPGNKTDRECEFKPYCWKQIKKHSVFELYQLQKKKQFELFHSGVHQIEDLPIDYPLNPMQVKQATCVNTKTPFTDIKGIKGFLSKVEYPIHYLDFETANPAIPRFNGMHPYEQIPFQFSCHIREGNGKLSHHEFLQLGKDDPREEFIKVLLKGIKSKGTIFSYHAVFEKGILIKLAEAFPQYGKEIESLLTRFVDLKDIFSEYYYHPDFHGSLSLKSIVSALFPSMTYEGMEIAEGASASAAYIRTQLESLTGAVIQTIEKNLRAYCEKDTLALVVIHNFFLDMMNEPRIKKHG